MYGLGPDLVLSVIVHHYKHNENSQLVLRIVSRRSEASIVGNRQVCLQTQAVMHSL